MSVRTLRLERASRISRDRALVLGAGVLWSLTALFVRLIKEADAYQITLLRSLGVIPVILVLVAIRNEGRVIDTFRAAGWTAVVGGAFMAVSNISAILALLNTSVANTSFMLGFGPLLTAVAGWLFLGERLDRRTLFWFVVAAIGVTIMTVAAIDDGRTFGNLMALLMVTSYTGFVLAVRRGKDVDMNPAIAWAGVFAGVFAAAMADDFQVLATDAVTGIAIGGLFMGGGLILYVAGSRTVAASELVLLGGIELVLSPLWVWLLLGEKPVAATLVGGAFVVVAVVARSLADSPPEVAAPPPD
ncbi:MAG: EamA family transporter [Acidimicrobiia bacterium]|nr:EamA family transporter [Acidimicrobiia bacterium]MDH4308909.1 EamA family transporter [Acidimicrobiia bacterium]